MQKFDYFTSRIRSENTSQKVDLYFTSGRIFVLHAPGLSELEGMEGKPSAMSPRLNDTSRDNCRCLVNPRG